MLTNSLELIHYAEKNALTTERDQRDGNWLKHTQNLRSIGDSYYWNLDRRNGGKVEKYGGEYKWY